MKEKGEGSQRRAVCGRGREARRGEKGREAWACWADEDCCGDGSGRMSSSVRAHRTLSHSSIIHRTLPISRPPPSGHIPRFHVAPRRRLQLRHCHCASLAPFIPPSTSAIAVKLPLAAAALALPSLLRPKNTQVAACSISSSGCTCCDIQSSVRLIRTVYEKRTRLPVGQPVPPSQFTRQPRTQFCRLHAVSLPAFRTGRRYALALRMQTYPFLSVQSTACDIRSSDESLHRLPIRPPHAATSFDFRKGNTPFIRVPYCSSHALSHRHGLSIELPVAAASLRMHASSLVSLYSAYLVGALALDFRLHKVLSSSAALRVRGPSPYVDFVPPCMKFLVSSTLTR